MLAVDEFDLSLDLDEFENPSTLGKNRKIVD